MTKPRHLFPSLLSKPLSLMQGQLHASLVSNALNQPLAGQISDGKLEFMAGRNLQVEGMDASIRFTLRFDGGHLLAERDTQFTISSILF